MSERIIYVKRVIDMKNGCEFCKTFGYGDVLNWWDGMITTEDLFEIFEE